jgi:hypothetical protein
MYRFNGIGGVDNPANILWILETLAEPVPIVSPGFDNNWIFIVPFIRQDIQLLFRQILVVCFIYAFHVHHKFLLVLEPTPFSGYNPSPGKFMSWGFLIASSLAIINFKRFSSWYLSEG